MRYSSGSPYFIARIAAHAFLEEHVCRSLRFEDVCAPAPAFELSAPIGARYGLTVDEHDINAALFENMPSFGDINVFYKAYVEKGYVNFEVNDAFMVRHAEIIGSEPDKQYETLLLPDSPEYACARLLNYAEVFTEYVPSRPKRRALWLCLGLMEELPRIKLRRAHTAAVRSTISAFEPDEGHFGGSVAAAMATLLSSVNKLLMNK